LRSNAYLAIPAPGDEACRALWAMKAGGRVKRSEQAERAPANEGLRRLSLRKAQREPDGPELTVTCQKRVKKIAAALF